VAGERLRPTIIEGPLLHLSAALIKAIDLQLHIAAGDSGFGTLMIRVDHGRVAGFEAMTSSRWKAGEAA
jgi:hypothetical protein